MIFFRPFEAEACCLCGSAKNLTGEHKIKASAIKAEFGSSKMVIGNFDVPDASIKAAQSPKSKAFHFEVRLCADCNGARTQAADREFDHFHTLASQLLANGEDPALAFEDERYKQHSVPFLNLFRYFAKLLCCHMAEVRAPRPVHMSRFAIGKVHTNCIWLLVDEDWSYKQAAQTLGKHQYAAHGGLVIYSKVKTGEANAFHSTLTVGPLRYVYHSRLNWFERMAIRLAHRPFREWCRNRARDADSANLSDTDKLKLGISSVTEER